MSSIDMIRETMDEYKAEIIKQEHKRLIGMVNELKYRENKGSYDQAINAVLTLLVSSR